MSQQNALLALQLAAHPRPLTAPNAETGLARLHDLLGRAWNEDALRAALADALRQKLIHDPLRLSEQSLHCSWRLELTQSARDALGALLAARDLTPDALIEQLRNQT